MHSCLCHMHVHAGGAFYRTESGPARDLSILAAAAHKAATGRLHVLDVMAGSGMRGARYVAQVCKLCRQAMKQRCVMVGQTTPSQGMALEGEVPAAPEW